MTNEFWDNLDYQGPSDCHFDHEPSMSKRAIHLGVTAFWDKARDNVDE